MNCEDLMKEIISGRWTSEELDNLTSALRFARDFKAKQAKLSLRVGHAASFKDRTGKTLTGVVSKINNKSILIFVDGARWRVSPSLVSAA